jgi:septal ring factor EnvC (AmiA/AmiB activator)
MIQSLLNREIKTMLYIPKALRTQWKKYVVLFVVSILAFIFAQSVYAQDSNRLKQKSQAEAERSELKKKLSNLKRDISKTESAKEKAGDALEESEQAISEANRSLRDLSNEQKQAEEKLRQLNEEHALLTLKADTQKKQLSDFLKMQYMYGDSDRLKLLLSGDNPNRINRDLQYMSYVSKTQARMIENLRVSLQEVEANQQTAQETKNALDEIAQEERDNKKILEKEKNARNALLKELADKLYKQKKEAENLRKDEQRLSTLVTRLNKIMEEQAKAALAEKQRREKLAKERADALREKNRLAKLGQKTDTIVVPDEPKESAKSLGSVDQTPYAGYNDGKDFKQLKGQLYLPVKGDIIAKFGKQRGDGPSWKGLFIRSAEGADVKVIAAGNVVFAEWMRGFGNMIIIDHGGQYLSLYSNNQAVLKHVGDKVKAGDVIASAGNSGGNEETGVYFEMRYRGQVFDPMTWVRK